MPKTSTFNIRDVFHLIFKRKIQILLFFVATATTVVIATLMTKPIYRTTSQIQVKVGRENYYIPISAKSGNFRPVISHEEQINSAIEILKGQSLAEKVVEALGPTTIYKPNLDEDKGGLIGSLKKAPKMLKKKINIFIAKLRESFQSGQHEQPSAKKAVLRSPVEIAIENLKRALAIERIKGTNLIEVSFQHEDPQIAATVTNKLASLYLERYLHIHKTSQSLNFFQKQSRILQTKLRHAEEKLMAFKSQHNVTSLEEERSLLLKQIAELRALISF